MSKNCIDLGLTKIQQLLKDNPDNKTSSELFFEVKDIIVDTEFDLFEIGVESESPWGES